MNWSQSDLDRRNAEMGIAPRADAQLAAIREGRQGIQVAGMSAAKPKSRMNKWETEYEARLRAKWAAGLIQWYAFEPFKLRLADQTTYTPDFAVLDAGRLEFHEVKGFWREDALVKFKVAAELFPFLFCAWRKKKVSEGGGWDLVRYINGAAINRERKG